MYPLLSNKYYEWLVILYIHQLFPKPQAYDGAKVSYFERQLQSGIFPDFQFMIIGEKQSNWMLHE